MMLSQLMNCQQIFFHFYRYKQLSAYRWTTSNFTFFNLVTIAYQQSKTTGL